MTKVINIHHKVPYDVYIGRPSKWSNKWSHLESNTAAFKVNTREEAIAKYREWIKEQPELLAALPELKDKILGCWCSPKACHGDVLVELLKDLEHQGDVDVK